MGGIVRIRQHPRQRTTNLDLPRVPARRRHMDIVERRNLEADARQAQRVGQLAREVVGPGRGDRIVERLQLAERLVRLAARLLRPPLNVVAQQGLGPQEGCQHLQVLRHLHPHDVRDGPREFPERQERLNAVAFVHVARLRFCTAIRGWPRKDRLRLAGGAWACQRTAAVSGGPDRVRSEA